MFVLVLEVLFETVFDLNSMALLDCGLSVGLIIWLFGYVSEWYVVFV